jgi:hypothetical protein
LLTYYLGKRFCIKAIIQVIRSWNIPFWSWWSILIAIL